MALVSVSELMGRKFHVPSYQRGYRWGRVEIEALLDDLKEFLDSDPGKNEFYCLQPIVLYKNPETEQEELLDGQQRLTTLYLLLVYLEKARMALNLKKEIFSLTYATRPDSENFLATGGFKTHSSANIDYYYMSEAYCCITKWFERTENEGIEGDMARLLLQPTERGANVRLIEYVLEDDSEPIEVFLRLNQGKIPLTDAELVKALLLQKDKYLPKEKEDKKEVNMEAIQAQLDLIAGEWYGMERALAEPDRWAFIEPQNYTAATHIDLILQLTAFQYLNPKNEKYAALPRVFEKEGEYKYPCYVLFSEIIKQHTDRIACIKEIWERVRGVYEFIDEWYNEHTLYHYIGFLLSQEVTSLESLLEEAMQKGREAFEAFLRQKIGEVTKCEFEKLNYEEIRYRSQIQRLLFFHNVMSTEKANGRFPFAQYRTRVWSLEHITPQNPDPPTTFDAWIEWLDSHRESLERRDKHSKLIKELKDLAGKLKKQEKERSKKEQSTELLTELESLFEKVLKQESKLSENNLHFLGNLCLIEKRTNTSLSNASFDVKREKIRLGGLDYIPLATRRVFVKGYSVYPQNNYFWDDADAKAYFNDIQETYKQFKQ